MVYSWILQKEHYGTRLGTDTHHDRVDYISDGDLSKADIYMYMYSKLTLLKQIILQ